MKIIIIFIALILTAFAIIYYFYYYIPNNLVSSLLKEIEFEICVNTSKYFLSNKESTLYLSWNDIWNETKKDSLALSEKNQRFDLWVNNFLGGLDKYSISEITVNNPDPMIMTAEEFEDIFLKWKYSEIEIKIKKYSSIFPKKLLVKGYVTLEHEDLFFGRKQFEIIVKKGNKGWKAVYFTINLK